MVLVEGIAVSGEQIAEMGSKTFTVMKGAYYKELIDRDNPGEMKKKLIMLVELSDGSQVDYYPNKTSQKTMVELTKSTNTDDWIGKSFEWEVVDQKVMKEMKKVLYVLAK